MGRKQDGRSHPAGKEGMSKYEAAIKCCIDKKSLKSTGSECRLKLDFEPYINN